MHYLQMEFEAHDRQKVLLREARERHLARVFKKSRTRDDDGLLKKLHLRGLVALIWRDPAYEVLSEVFEKDGEATPRPTERSKTAGTS